MSSIDPIAITGVMVLAAWVASDLGLVSRTTRDWVVRRDVRRALIGITICMVASLMPLIVTGWVLTAAVVCAGLTGLALQVMSSSEGIWQRGPRVRSGILVGIACLIAVVWFFAGPERVPLLFGGLIFQTHRQHFRRHLMGEHEDILGLQQKVARLESQILARKTLSHEKIPPGRNAA